MCVCVCVWRGEGAPSFGPPQLHAPARPSRPQPPTTHSPHPPPPPHTAHAQKYWITNASVHAQWAVVFAQLWVGGANQGIHGFLVR